MAILAGSTARSYDACVLDRVRGLVRNVEPTATEREPASGSGLITARQGTHLARQVPHVRGSHGAVVHAFLDPAAATLARCEATGTAASDGDLAWIRLRSLDGAHRRAEGEGPGVDELLRRVCAA